MTLALAAPLDDGGSAIRRYILKARPGNLQVEVEVDAGEERGELVQVVLPGLERGRKYRVTAQAQNALGTGMVSTGVDVLLE